MRRDTRGRSWLSEYSSFCSSLWIHSQVLNVVIEIFIYKNHKLEDIFTRENIEYA